ncbi:MAG: 3-isopropylmalate dehydratase large subunit [Methanosarcinaceae archaeon]|nr:3-isopropylmalate dehydratase large subunit [Methanosarcinaceae archaeon]
MKEQTLSEKIFSLKSGKDVFAGEYTIANIDCAMIHDVTGPLAVDGFYKIFEESNRLHGKNSKSLVFDKDKVILLFDHQVPADSIKAAENHIYLRKFAKEQNLTYFYDIYEGICHQVLPEKGHVLPGSLVLGADSHTCAYGALGSFATGVGSTDMANILATGKLWFKVPETVLFNANGKFSGNVCSKDLILSIIGKVGADGCTYKAAEFKGSAVSDMDISQRMTVSNMAIEMGAKTGIIEPDKKTYDYVSKRNEKFANENTFDDLKFLKSDESANFSEVHDINVNDLNPKVACPDRVDFICDAEDVKNVSVDQIFIGSCTNGRFEDFEMFLNEVGDEPFAKNVRVIAVPASRTEYMKLLKAGYIEKLIEKGAIVESACCGPCMGASFGRLGKKEVGLSTSNRNFKGRQGSPDASVYLCSPKTAGASAVTGEITAPEK